VFELKEEFLKYSPYGRLLALDMGTKRIGVAVCDELRKIAIPSDTIYRKGNKIDIPIILEMIRSKNIKGIIIGLPISFDEKETNSSIFVRRFVENLLKLTNVPIFLQDERLSSFEAEDLMLDSVGYNKTKIVVDKISASYILESFLNN